ncbi:MAG: leucyl/phenylalanyl-tRNA--protein transferase, partial [Holophagales bacterium]|nr:leucyl/phenylalanyl-tRNA--protein transferase [Holophagales bacterium]
MIDTELLPHIRFPDPREADEYGLVAIGGDFRPEVLLIAYASGIFPWPSEDLPYAWFSPDPRLVLYPD